MSKRKSPPMAAFFTPEDYQRLRQARHDLANVIGECDRASACGIDIDHLRDARNQVDQQLAAIEQHYFGNQVGG